MRELISEPGPKLTEKDIRDLELCLGSSLPSDYRKFLIEYNGGTPSSPLYKHKRIIEISTFLSVARGSVDDISQVREYVSDTVDVGRYLPVARTYAGNLFFLGLHCGKVFFWEHDQPPNESEFDTLILLENSFASFLGHLSQRPVSNNRVDEVGREGDRNDLLVLIESGASLVNEFGHSVCEAAAKSNNVAVVAEWLNQGRDIGNSLHFAAMNGQFGVVDFLISKGYDINRINDKKQTPLDLSLWDPELISQIRARGGKRFSEL